MSLYLVLSICTSCLPDQSSAVKKDNELEFNPKEARKLALKYNLEACQEGGFSKMGKLTRPFCKYLVPKLLDEFADGSAELEELWEKGVADPALEEDRLVIIKY